MDWATALATYVIIWWLVMFMVLPWGVRRIEPEDLRAITIPTAEDCGIPLIGT